MIRDNRFGTFEEFELKSMDFEVHPLDSLRIGDGPSKSKLSNIWTILCLLESVTSDCLCFVIRHLPVRILIALK